MNIENEDLDPTDPDRLDKFSADAGDLILGQCSLCKHRARPATVPACKAFPGSIPDELLTNQADHRQPYPGDDQGMGEPGEHVLFEPRADVHPRILANLYKALDAMK